MGFQRQTEAGLLGHHPGVAGGDHADTLGTDEAARGFHPDDGAILLAEPGDLGLLDQVDAETVGTAREAPGHGVVTRHATARLPGGAENRIACAAGAVHRRYQFLHLPGVQHLAVDALQTVGVHATLDVTHVLQGVAQVEHATLGEHHVVVQVLGEAFPQLHGVLVKRRRLVPQIVGAHQGGVARGVATAQPALLDHRDIGDAVLLGQIVGRGQSMPAATDDDDIVFLLGFWATPDLLPVLMVAERMLDQPESRVTLHLPPSSHLCHRKRCPVLSPECCLLLSPE